MELWEIILIAGGCRDDETFETVIDTILFIEDNQIEAHPDDEAVPTT